VRTGLRASARNSSLILLLLAVVCAGCGKSAPGGNAANPAAGQMSVGAAKPNSNQLDMERADLEKIPSPLKSHYLSVATANAWQNPFVVVGTDSLKVIVMMADPNPSPMGAGGLLRPSGARKDIEEITPDKLGEMLSDLPAGAWPYGRVVAIEESKQPERTDRAAMRRNMEGALQTLSSLGVVANEWNEPGSAR
jgi:hypothetical protein